MTAHVARRLFESLLSLAALICAVFFISRLTGSPGALYLPLDATAEMIAEFNHEHGYDQPIYIQFFDFLAGLSHLDFGESLRRQASALDVVLEAYPATLTLAAITVAIALVLGVVLGCLAAVRPNSIFDRAATIVAVAGASIPEFWLALMGIILFALSLGWLPTSGASTPWHYVLPVAVLMTRPFGSLTQVARGSMVNALASPYIEAARGRGVGGPRLIFLHALRNAAIPPITVLGIQIAHVLNGAVVVETIFGWPGVGRLMISSILNRDFAVVQAAVVVIAFGILALNLLLDIAYGVIDPRTRS
jgi:peptide/nickel transport system permease protein